MPISESIGSRIGEIGGGILSKLISGTFIIVGILILGAIITGAILFSKYLGQFNIKARIKTKRGSGTDGKPVYKIFYDRGGILRKRADKRSFFRLLHEKVDLPKPPFEAIQISAKGGNEIEIIKEGDEDYSYVLPGSIEKGYQYNEEGLIVKTKVQGVKTIDAGSAYWNVLRKRDTRKMFSTEGLFMKLLPYAVPILMIMGVIFYTYIWLDKAPAIIAAADNVAKHLAEAAQALSGTQTAVVTGG